MSRDFHKNSEGARPGLVNAFIFIKGKLLPHLRTLIIFMSRMAKR